VDGPHWEDKAEEAGKFLVELQWKPALSAFKASIALSTCYDDDDALSSAFTKHVTHNKM